MAFEDYKSLWNHKASGYQDALMAVDGSFNEATVRSTGAFTANQVRHALALSPTDQVFEIGCGVARIGCEIIDEVGHWHGLDISENMLGVATRRLEGKSNFSLTSLTRSKLESLDDSSMDKGYCVAVFIHMDKEDFALYLREVFRVLKPGGCFYFDHWNLQHSTGLRRFNLELKQVETMVLGQRKDVGRNQFCTPSEVEIYSASAGLETALVLTNTPWIQVVLRKPDENNGSLALQKTRLAAVSTAIDYGPEWHRYYLACLEAQEKGIPPYKLLEISAEPAKQNDAVAIMFRRWIHGAWPFRATQWGDMPESLANEFD
ncbi:MAG: class I SAM-dependent methyltransferase [Arenimonas sp.]